MGHIWKWGVLIITISAQKCSFLPTLSFWCGTYHLWGRLISVQQMWMVKTELCDLWSQLEPSRPPKENAPNGIYQSKIAASFYFGHPLKKGRIKRGKGEMNPVKVFWHLGSAFVVLSICNTNLNLNETFWWALEMLLQWEMEWRVKEHSIKAFIKKGWASILQKIPPRPLHWDIWKENSKEVCAPSNHQQCQLCLAEGTALKPKPC